MGTMLRSRQRDSFVLIVSMEGDLFVFFFYLKKMTSVILPKFSEYVDRVTSSFGKYGRSCEDL